MADQSMNQSAPAVEGETALHRMIQRAAQSSAGTGTPVNSEDPNYWDKQVKDTRRRRELIQEEKMIESMTNPPTPDQPFKVSGGIHLGNFDIQEQQRKADEQRALERQEANRQMEAMRQENASLRDQVAGERIEGLRRDFTTKLEELKQNGNKDPKSLKEQVEELKEMANVLGMGTPKTPGDGGQAMVQIKLAEMEFAAEDRRQAHELALAKINADLAIQNRRLDIETRFKEREIDLQEKKALSLSNWPNQIGAALATYVTQGASAGLSPDTSQASAVTQRSISKPGDQLNAVITAAVGEANEVECPRCKAPVGFGPRTEQARCVSCGGIMPIQREAAVPAGAGLEEEDGAEH